MPQPGPQALAIYRHDIDELFYGGAVGGGKSDFLLGDFAQDVPQHGAGWQGILFRKTYPELSDLIRRSQEIYPPWFPGVVWHESDKEWIWPNGAILRMRYLEHSSDWMRYWGHAYTWIGWDELPTWSNLDAYMRMKARLRSAHNIPNKRIRATGNPGGPGHNAVKAYFKIDECPLGGEVFKDEASGMTRMFVRSRLRDNQILLQNDPRYGSRLHGLGSPDLVRAWLEGDWNVVAGSFFPEFTPERHVRKPFRVPEHWLRYRAMDWGSYRPFAVLWVAVSDGDIPSIPRGALVVYREWYGSTGEPNVGLKMPADVVAKEILALEHNENVTYGVIDPAAFSSDGGPSIVERMESVGCYWQRADNARVARNGAMGGWDQLRSRLVHDQIIFFDTCRHLIRTLPALQHDPDRPEDVDTDAEDHLGDATRYACMARPYVVDAPSKPEPKWPAQLTINELIERNAARRRESD